MKIRGLLDAIGNTPLIRLSKVTEDIDAVVLAKLEFLNPSGSIKDRMVLKIIQSAEEKEILKPNSILVEATTGNTGVSVAMISTVKGYKAILVMPKTTSGMKVKMMESFGAEIVKVPVEKGMKGVVEKANEIAKRKKAFLLDQFRNSDNIAAHRETTGKEILAQTDLNVDAFIAGVGTGGTLIGVAQALTKEIPDVKIVAVEPAEAPALYCNFYSKPAPKIRGIPHEIEGIGEGFVTKIVEDNMNLIDDVILVRSEGAIKMSRRLAKEEGLFVGISSGANIVASLKVAGGLGNGKTVVTVLPDGGHRYLTKLLG